MAGSGAPAYIWIRSAPRGLDREAIAAALHPFGINVVSVVVDAPCPADLASALAASAAASEPGAVGLAPWSSAPGWPVLPPPRPCQGKPLSLASRPPTGDPGIMRAWPKHKAGSGRGATEGRWSTGALVSNLEHVLHLNQQQQRRLQEEQDRNMPVLLHPAKAPVQAGPLSPPQQWPRRTPQQPTHPPPVGPPAKSAHRRQPGTPEVEAAGRRVDVGIVPPPAPDAETSALSLSLLRCHLDRVDPEGAQGGAGGGSTPPLPATAGRRPAASLADPSALPRDRPVDPALHAATFPGQLGVAADAPTPGPMLSAAAVQAMWPPAERMQPDEEPLQLEGGGCNCANARCGGISDPRSATRTSRTGSAGRVGSRSGDPSGTA